MGLLDDNRDNNFENTLQEPTENVGRKGGRAKTFLSFFGVILLIAIAVGGSIYVVKQKPEILGLTKNAGADDQKELEKIVSEVGKLMLLPNETPTLATVTDLSKVTDQAFFKNAKEGDKVLVYRVAKKAILYRPSENKIIEVGVVNITEEAAQQNNQLDVELLPSLTPAPTEEILSTPTIAPTQGVTIAPNGSVSTLSPSATPNPGQ